MKQTVFLSLTFAGVPQTTASIFIPFAVLKMHVKSLAYQADTNGSAKYVYLRSSLGLNAPLGILNQDTTYSSNTVNDVEIAFQNKQVIQGNYTFTLYNMDGTLATITGAPGTDYIGLIIEFNSENEL